MFAFVVGVLWSQRVLTSEGVAKLRSSRWGGSLKRFRTSLKRRPRYGVSTWSE